MKELNELLKMSNENFYAAVKERNVSKIREFVERSVEELMQFNERMQFDELQENQEPADWIGQWSVWIQALKSCMDTSEEQLYYYIGLLSGVIVSTRQKQKEEKRVRDYFVQKLHTGYYKAIFHELAKADYVQHKELAEKLCMSTSQLTNIMKKIADDDQDFIISAVSGKFKYYFLSDAGRKFYRDHLEQTDRKEMVELLDCMIRGLQIGRRKELIQYVESHYSHEEGLRKKIYELDRIMRDRVSGIDFNNQQVEQLQEDVEGRLKMLRELLKFGGMDNHIPGRETADREKGNYEPYNLYLYSVRERDSHVNDLVG